MDKSLRNILRHVVTQSRRLLEDSIKEQLEGHFGIRLEKNGAVTFEQTERLTHLSSEDRDYREQIVAHVEHIKAGGFKPKDAFEQLVREVAFTHLNRLCAYKMMEKRALIREAVSRGMKSQGFPFYLAKHPDDEKLWSGGKQDLAYRRFLESLAALFANEIGALFSPDDPANRLFPPQRVLDQVLELINGDDLKAIWTEDETIGWIYQYFTPKELRDQARKESAAPRNSYELAFRNQFFTPQYVVQFLTDNTLGRIWYEMRKGHTILKDKCQYLVRRPKEVFLAEGETAPKSKAESTDLSQEELLKQPMYILHVPKKDPRELRILDPACGSGHFLLYCFLLLLWIYEEAYDDPELGPKLRQDYPDCNEFTKAVPGLILRHNLHGIDIDLRATQIAALALWLRAQKAYDEMGLKPEQRPKITRSNIVCAEPMPGEQELLDEFVAELQPKVLGQLVRVVFDKMKLAGEAGSLLKIEEELRDSIAAAKKQWISGPKPEQMSLFPEKKRPKPEQMMMFDVSGITDEQFWDEAETRVIEALRDYAKRAANGKGLSRRLFAEDAERGFALVDICRQRFDVVVMNPPFGSPTPKHKKAFKTAYSEASGDLYTGFIARGLGILVGDGLLGAITNRTALFLTSFSAWRQSTFDQFSIDVFADLGSGVLDSALVETSCYVLGRARDYECESPFYRLLQSPDKAEALNAIIRKGVLDSAKLFFKRMAFFRKIPTMPLAYWLPSIIADGFESFPSLLESNFDVHFGLVTSDDFRFLRLFWEVAPQNTGNRKRWVLFAKGGRFEPYYSDVHLMLNFEDNGRELKAFLTEKYAYLDGNIGWLTHPESNHLHRGLTYPLRTTSCFAPRVLPEGCMFGHKGPSVFWLGNEGEAEVKLMYALALLNSKCFQAFLSARLGAAEGAARSYEIGVIKDIPLPKCTSESESALAKVASQCVQLRTEQERGEEVNHLFCQPKLLLVHGDSLEERQLNWNSESAKRDEQLRLSEQAIDEMVFRLYAFPPEDRDELDAVLQEKTSEQGQDDGESEDEEESEDTDSSFVTALVSYFVGCVLGRWDLTYATGQQPISQQISPFTALGANCLGALTAKETPSEYPLLIDWDGILVDDPEHQGDIVRRVRDVLGLLWKDKAEAIEKEGCEILGAKELRDYFRKPGNGGFWIDHVKRYSKSRRKAPIYWLLQSSKKNYALWLYYHRLDKDFYYKALVKYVEPKIKLEESLMKELRDQRASAGVAGRQAKQLERDLENQESFISELHDFQEKLKRVADLNLVPDFDDGVILNIAPLHELVPWSEPKKYWDELLEGKYQWSSIGKQLRERGMVKDN